jgi:5,5'-dehydrodivanillate O-demethylase oxygenase subunit
MYWAYLGPLPAPEIPRYDVWARTDGTREIMVHPMIDCNWLQASENSVDPAHLQILHQEITGGRRTPPSTTRGFTDDIEGFDFYVFPHGIIKKRIYKNGVVDEHPLLFPTVLRVNNGTEIRVPIDDTHITIFEPVFTPTDDGSTVDEGDELSLDRLRPFKEPQDRLHPFARFRWDQVPAQDAAAWETQGPIADRTTERLATSDKGVVLLRQVVKENIERVQQGLDPLGVIRDPNHAIIDTKLNETIEHMRRRGMLPEKATATVKAL